MKQWEETFYYEDTVEKIEAGSKEKIIQNFCKSYRSELSSHNF